MTGSLSSGAAQTLLGPEHGTNENWIGGFGLPGTNERVTVMSMAGEKIFVGGSFSAAGGSPVDRVAEWNGSSWVPLGTPEVNGVDGDVQAMAADGDLLYVGGGFTRAGNIISKNLAAWNHRSRTWTSLGSGAGVSGLPDSRITSMLVVNGQLYVAGRFSTVDTIVAVNIARWDGRRWHRVGDGLNGEVVAMATDGENLFVSGRFTLAGDERVPGFARWNIAEQRWHDLGVGTNAQYLDIKTIAVSERYLYIGGLFRFFNGLEMNNIARWDRQSERWQSLGQGLGWQVNTLAVRGEELFVGGNIEIVPGRCWSASCGPRHIVKWDGNQFIQWMEENTWTRHGVVDVSTTNPSATYWRDNHFGEVNAILVRPDGSLLLGGSFDLAGPMNIAPDTAVGGSSVTLSDRGVLAANVAMFDDRDSVWQALGGGFDDIVRAISSSDGFLYAAGSFGHSPGGATRRIARLNPGTGSWEALPGDLSGEVNTMITDPRGLVIGGSFSVGGVPGARNVVRFDGSSFAALGSGIPSTSAGDGIVREVIGLSTDVYAAADNGLWRWNGSNWVNLLSGWSLADATAVVAIGSDLWVGGSFNRTGPTASSHLLRIDAAGGGITQVPGGPNGVVRALAHFQGDLYVGGEFASLGALDAAYIVRYDLDAEDWSAVGDTLDGPVFEFQEGKYGLYVGGNFSLINGRTPARAIALWTGSRWHDLGYGLQTDDGTGSVFAIHADAMGLWVGGDFRYTGSVSSYYLARWIFPEEGAFPDDPPPLIGSDDKAPGAFANAADCEPLYDDVNWRSTFSLGADGEVFALAAINDQNVYAGGAFEKVLDLQCNGIAFWDGKTWRSLGSGPDVGVDGYIYAIAIRGDSVIVGGQFTSAGGVPARNLAWYSRSNASWHPLGGGISGEDGLAFVSSLALDGSRLYVGGNFDRAGEVGVANVAMLEGETWSDLEGGTDGLVNALLVSRQNLYVGGSFSRAGLASSNSIARFDGESWHSLDGGLNGAVNALAERPRGGILVGGEFNLTEDSTSLRNLLFWNDTIFSTVPADQNRVSVLGPVRAIAVIQNVYFVGGSFDQVLPQGTISEAGRFSNVAVFWEQVPWRWERLDDGLDGPVNALAVAGGHLFAGGAFTASGTEVGAHRVARWHIADRYWDAVASYPRNQVRALALRGDTLFAGGVFAATANAREKQSGISRFLASGWTPIDGVISGELHTARMVDDTLYFGGEFITSGERISVNVGKVDPDSDAWLPLTRGSGVAGGDRSWVAALEHDDHYLFVGGSFTVADTMRAANIARWNRTTGHWSPIGRGFNGPVWALLRTSNGTLYAGGDFSASGERSVYGIARLEGDQWMQIGQGLQGRIYALEEHEGALFAGGRFVLRGESDTISIARFDAGEDRWVRVGAGLNHVHLATVEALESAAGYLYAGGLFTWSDRWDTRNYVAKWDGTDWQRLGSGMNKQVRAILGTGNEIYFGGVFTSAGCRPAPFVALWSELPTSTPQEEDSPPAIDLSNRSLDALQHWNGDQ